MGHDTVLILGAGPIGVAFAAAFAASGVTLCDPDPAARADISARLAEARAAMASVGRNATGPAPVVLPHATPETVAKAALILECGPEHIETKCAILSPLLP